MKRLAIRRASAWFFLVLALGTGGDDRPARGADVPAGLEPIGGRWFVRKGERPTYVFRDGDTYVDLFSYHARDSVVSQAG